MSPLSVALSWKLFCIEGKERFFNLSSLTLYVCDRISNVAFQNVKKLVSNYLVLLVNYSFTILEVIERII